MNFIKKNKKMLIALLVIVFIIILILFLFNIIFGGNDGDVYGNRLDGISAVEIKKDENEKMKSEINDLAEVNKVSYNIKGRLLKVIIEYNDNVELSTAKDIASKVLDYYQDNQKAYYDIEVFLTANNNDTYPTIGYKNKNSEGFVWKQE